MLIINEMIYHIKNIAAVIKYVMPDTASTEIVSSLINTGIL